MHVSYRGLWRACVALAAWAVPVSARPDPECLPADADFRLTTLVSRDAGNRLEEPIRMALDTDAAGEPVIYFVQRYGKIRRYDGATGRLATLGTLPVDVKLEDGVTGIALDPGFRSNRWLYLYYATGTAADFRFRLSRFHLDAAGMLDMASERPILVIPASKGKSHTGGSMRFDARGDLYLGIGENEGGELSAANTNDLRGKILRIRPLPFPDAEKPEPGPGSTYAVPPGNLFPAGGKTRPEIYVMGDRNPYTLTLDDRTGRLAWGELGPNGTDSTEEDDITATPGNFGYPYYAGRQVAVTPNPGTPEAPINANAANTGLRELPPARPPARAYLRSAAMTGPIYRADRARPGSRIAMPARFDGLWFVTDFNTGEIDTLRLDASGLRVAAMGRAFPKLRLDAPIDFQQGPDGALYVVDYGGYFSSTPQTALVRIEYTGPCRAGPSVLAGRPAADGARLSLSGRILRVEWEGAYRLRVFDTRGRTVLDARGRSARGFDVGAAAAGRPGVYAVRLEAGGVTTSKRFLLAPGLESGPVPQGDRR
jgi:cytochrome c